MIIIMTQCFPSRLGGIESLVSNLALGLSKKDKVMVLADKYHYFHDSIYDNLYKNKIIIKRVGGLKYFRRRKKIKDLKFLIETNKVDLVIADTWKSLELGIDFLNKKNIKILCLAHGNELLFDNDNKYERIYTTLNKANVVVANSKFTLDLVKKILPDKKNVKYVYPGASDLRQVKSNNFVKINGNPILITIARLEKRKGHESVLKAIKKLILKFPHIQYFIAGEGSEKKLLKKLVNHYKLDSNVFFVGLVNDSQKEYLFKNADLMIMPTLDESKNRSIEGFGIVYLEAAFFGIPSIASNVGGTSEAVLHNKTGVIIENIDNLYETIHKLLIDHELRKQLGKEAKERAIKEFNWDIVTNKYLDTIDN